MDDDVAALAETMAEVARLLQRTDTVQDTWEAIVGLAAERLDGVEHVGITVVRRGRFSTPAASDELPRRVDELQYETGQGPCLTAIVERGTFLSGDLGQETTRWPDFGPRAADQLGVHSMLSYRLFVDDDTLGAMNFYSSHREAFDGDMMLTAGSVFAAHAALAMANAAEHEKVMHLERALDTSRLIGAACGILMAQHRITEEQAFEVLRTVSQNDNRKLRDVADDLVHTGQAPDVRPLRPRR